MKKVIKSGLIILLVLSIGAFILYSRTNRNLALTVENVEKIKAMDTFSIRARHGSGNGVLYVVKFFTEKNQKYIQIPERIGGKPKFRTLLLGKYRQKMLDKFFERALKTSTNPPDYANYSYTLGSPTKHIVVKSGDGFLMKILSNF